LGWNRYVGQTGAKLQEKFGFTPEHAVKQAKQQIQLTKTQ